MSTRYKVTLHAEVVNTSDTPKDRSTSRYSHTLYFSFYWSAKIEMWLWNRQKHDRLVYWSECTKQFIDDVL